MILFLRFYFLIHERYRVIFDFETRPFLVDATGASILPLHTVLAATLMVLEGRVLIVIQLKSANFWCYFFFGPRVI